MAGGFSNKAILIIFRCSRTEMFFETGVIGNFAIFTGKFTTLFQPRTERVFNTGVFLWKLQIPCFIEHLWWLLLSVWKSNCSIMMSIYQSFLDQKQKMLGSFLVKRFVDLISLSYLPIISRNNTNTLLLINLQKTKTCPK